MSNVITMYNTVKKVSEAGTTVHGGEGGWGPVICYNNNIFFNNFIETFC